MTLLVLIFFDILYFFQTPMTTVPSKQEVDDTDYDTHVTSYDHFSISRYYRLLDIGVGGSGVVSSAFFGPCLVLQLVVRTNSQFTELGKHLIIPGSYVAPCLILSFVAWSFAKYVDFRGLSEKHNTAGIAFNTIHRRARRLYEDMNSAKANEDYLRNEWIALNLDRDEVEKSNAIPTWKFVHKISKKQVQKEREERMKSKNL